MNKYRRFKFIINDDSYFELRAATHCFKCMRHIDYAKILFYKKNQNPIVVFNHDIIMSALRDLIEMIDNFFANKLIVPFTQDLSKGVGYHHSYAYYIDAQNKSNEKQKPKWSRYQLYTTSYNKTVWLYEYNDEVYIEYARLYSILPSNSATKFNAFAKDYKPQVLEKISRQRLKQWHTKATMLYARLERGKKLVVGKDVFVRTQDKEAYMIEQRPKVGIGVLIFNKKDEVLLGKRMSNHGYSTWGPPGGHLEYGESFEECAIREVKEETGLIIENAAFLAVTNDVFEQEDKHYVSIFMCASIDQQEVKNMEPKKIREWKWFCPKALPPNLFLPLQQLNQGVCYGLNEPLEKQ